ncbi:MAG: hypothetical protein K2G28_10835 [Acetatifactor sp.]|nr:hypothetical protein [Acetatifactor sp.]MDE7352674.1 hypothetical protein [Acetatifactor sp.]
MMEYEEIKQLKQSEKSTVYLVREKGSSQVFVKKVLTGQHPVYRVLQKLQHPCLPKLYQTLISEDSTTVIEEYIEGQSSGKAELSEKQFLHSGPGNAYRFTVQVYSSRPNEYASSPMPDFCSFAYGRTESVGFTAVPFQ